MDAVSRYTFIVQKTKGGKVVQVTASPKKADALLSPGYRVEVWRNTEKLETIYSRTREKLNDYTPPTTPRTETEMKVLDAYRDQLTPQQYKVLKGQILAGDTAGAKRGLKKILRMR